MVAAVGLVVAVAGCDTLLTRPGFYNHLEVVATRRDGTPIPGVRLVLYTAVRPVGIGATGADGRYTFRDVPEGNYGVFATAPAPYTAFEHIAQGTVTSVIDGLLVARDTLSPVHFRFKGPGAVDITVTTDSGAPLDSVHVTLYTPTQTIITLITDPNGRVEFDSLAIGQYGVVVEPPPYYRDFAPGERPVVIRDGLSVPDEGVHDSATIALHRCTGSLTAVVRDQNGAAVPGVGTVFYTSTQSLTPTITTDSNGSARLAEAPCATQLGVRVVAGSGYSIVEGRGSSFDDGIVLFKGDSVFANLRVQKAP